MREIKFRIYNLRSCEFEFFNLNDLLTNFSEGKNYPFYNGITKYSLPCNEFTGLKDKSGKEIFEGDIIKRRKDKPNDILLYGLIFSLTGRDHVVKFENHSFKPMSGFVNNDELEWEIIGNIYENPDLLENKNVDIS